MNMSGMRLDKGELIHANLHRSIIIPQDVIPTLRSSIEAVVESEVIVLAPACAPSFDIHKLKEFWAAFEAARTYWHRD